MFIPLWVIVGFIVLGLFVGFQRALKMTLAILVVLGLAWLALWGFVFVVAIVEFICKSGKI